MGLSSEHPWYWIEKNRQRPLRAMAAGSIAESMLKRLESRLARGSALVRRVESLVDEEFRRECTIGPLHRGCLTIFVRDERRAHAIRAQWLFPLLKHLSTGVLGMGVSRIEFRAGMGIPLTEGQPPADPKAAVKSSARAYGHGPGSKQTSRE